MPAQLCHIELADDELHYLQSCARIRHLSTRRLIRHLIATIARDQLVLSVLDDNSQPHPQEPQARYHRSKLFQDC
jgi:hypothetical protein